MTKKQIYAFLFFIFAYGQDDTKIQSINTDLTREGWDIGFDHINLNFSSTSIKNHSPYNKFSNTHFKGNSQIIAEASLLFHSNYYAQNFVIFNTIFGEYGRNIIYPEKQKTIDNTTLDKIIFSTDYTQKIWNFDAMSGFSIGPYVQFYYQTQLFKQKDINRINILHLGSGMKLFDGIYIKSFYVNFFGEQNFTYASPVQNLGYNIGATLNYPFNDTTKLTSYINFKHYLYNNYPTNYKPQYEFELKTRLETAIFKYFSVAPFINFYLLKGQTIKNVATNLMIGISLSYGQIYKDSRKKENKSPKTSQKS
ncbi:hypothetical protein [Helicobacter anatolicus]|uniref:hypothetical protein n=1 Tax=Helicobacter anatolicus TaxID=2905874 RepID=UPI001E40BA7E|nr:hypothetical protein [Helicobacter anatolicus]MCE3037945.1 hypothetical protein [Helicobacter anatolicus]